MITLAISNDAPEVWGLGFQDPASPQFMGIVELHNTVAFYLVIVTIAVFWVLFTMIFSFNSSRSLAVHKYLTHGATVETVWTIIPAIALLLIAIPSLALMFLLDDGSSPSVTIKVVGHQWYWSYEYCDYLSADGDPIEFDSYMTPTEDLEEGALRSLEVDRVMGVPVDTVIRLVGGSSDVIHSFGLPSAGLKMDVIPGRLNQASFTISRESTLYGQCSELCGVAHAYMPIVVEAYSPSDYLLFLESLVSAE